MKKNALLFAAVSAAAATYAYTPETIMLYPENSPEICQGEFAPHLLLYPADTKKGTILILPGGGYHNRATEREGLRIAEKFMEMGFNAAVLEYRVSPARYPAPQRDVLRAVKLLRANAKAWNIDPEKIAVLGFSAGGHLAGCAGTLCNRIDVTVGDEADQQSARPDAIILCYPVVTLAGKFAHRGSSMQLLGENAADEMQQKLSLQNCVDEQTPPAFLWHTAADQTVPVGNSILFARAMWQHQRPAELHVFPFGGHGKDLAIGVTDAWQWPEMAARFLREVANFPAAN